MTASMSLFNPTLPGLSGRPRDPALSLAAMAGAAGVHAAALALLFVFVPAGQIAEMVRPLTVRLIELAPEIRPAPPAPKPAPVRHKPKPQPPAPVIAVSTPLPAVEAPAFVVPPPPAPAPVAVPPAPTFAPAPPAPITQARFDAEYLKNPKPAYPSTSRRLGEEGKVVLRVRVDARGEALDVEIKGSSGFARLDSAARDAVAQWRFVPARRGDEPIAAWVLVPIVFSLES
jgi:protein TonB